MRPIEICVTGRTAMPPAQICEEYLDIDRWSQFQGYALIPGIAQARFEKKTPEVLGSRIRVRNKDGSSHVEEVIEWDVTRQIAFRFQEFDRPLKYFASHFIETWTFSNSSGDTEVTRRLAMHPKSVLGWVLLFPISRMMKKAFEINKLQLAARPA